MASLGSLGVVNLSNIGSVGDVNISRIGAINSVNVVTTVDSINISPNPRFWDGATEAGVQKSFVLTSSGAWNATKSDPNNIISAFTASGTGSGTVYVTVGNPAAKTATYASITYTTGSASVVLNVCISGTIRGEC
mgnify:CR=1 FL=1